MSAVFAVAYAIGNGYVSKRRAWFARATSFLNQRALELRVKAGQGEFNVTI